MPAYMGEAQVRAELIALLAYANKSEVARALGVTTQAVINWSQGRNTSSRRLAQIRALYGLDTKKEAPRPEWAEGLESRVADAVVMRLDESPGAALEAELVRLGLLPSEPLTEGSPERQAGAHRAPRPPARQGGKG